ncbi:MAG: SMC family ATPase, partial [Lachnospiraceae bacterium]|nr:SMC family ATPase [Lachnospiraceae bacterium]
LRQIEEAVREVRKNESVLERAEAGAAAAQKLLKELEEQEALWRRQERELADTPQRLAVWEKRNETMERLAAELDEIEALYGAVREQERKSRQAKNRYQEASEAYRKAKDAYEQIRREFLDAQAGILAGDLREGRPCPVCGSLEHPHPARYIARRGQHETDREEASRVDLAAYTRSDLTQETLDHLSREADRLAGQQQKRAADAQEAAGLLNEKRENLQRGFAKLQRELMEAYAHADAFTGARSDDPADTQMGAPVNVYANGFSGAYESAALDAQEAGLDTGHSYDWRLAQAADWISAQRQSMEREREGLERQRNSLAAVRQSLNGIEERKQTLRENAETAKNAASEARAQLEGSRQRQKTLGQSVSFSTRKEAETVLDEAKQAKLRQEMLGKKASEEAVLAKERRDRMTALFQKYTLELPEQEEQCAAKQEAYIACMEQRGLSETVWMELTQKHTPEEEQVLRDQVEQHVQKKTAAESRRASAKETIGDRKKPVPETLEWELRETERGLSEAEERLAWIGEVCREDERTRKALRSKLGERRRALEEYTRLDTLYRLVSGNVKDSRMDLETFVQRYYMERILRAANHRFLEMSGGQFELRMIGAEKAGKGKNRGLDLMVYSAVTGKEREIRTLSGGESFMAALSLALGMADQIQQSTAAIHLDMMFIDEGFGSLDEHSRNQAVRVLQEMAGGDKLIGIISHVTELKQEIDVQLIVTKDETGSHVRWQIS